MSLGSLAFGLISAPVFGWSSPTVAGALLVGLLLLVAFIWEETRSPAPMLPLGLFRSRTFSAVNLLTLLLYAGLGGAFFFLPFALIQVEGFSAVLAGAAFLPFTLIMATLSRWAGGLLDRFGAKGPLIIGPAIAALGFALFAWPDRRRIVLGLSGADRDLGLWHGHRGGAADGDGDRRRSQP